MAKFSDRISSVAALVLTLFSITLPNAYGKHHTGNDGGVHTSTQTALYVSNASNIGVYCILTVNSPSAITNLAVNGFSTWTTPSGPPLPTPSPPSATSLFLTCPSCVPLTQGFFYLPKGALVQVTSNLSAGALPGVSVAFLQPPDTCPGSSSGFYPFGAQPQITATNGTNFAEVTLNVTTGEQADISCNNGANAKINVTTVGGPYWMINGNSVASFSTTNSWVNGTTGADNNCAIAGVFPYQYTQCTAGPNACANSPANSTCPTSSPNNGLCEFARPAGQTGGTIYVTFIGPEHPPH